MKLDSPLLEGAPASQENKALIGRGRQAEPPIIITPNMIQGSGHDDK
jgi:hypothetical protein